MDRVARVKERLELVKLEAKRIGEAGPPCSSCRYSALQYCKNPAMFEQVFEPATGKYSAYSVTTLQDARSEGGLCGPEAFLHERPGWFFAKLSRGGEIMDRHPLTVLFVIMGLLALYSLLDVKFGV